MGESQFQLLVAAGNPVAGDVTANVQVHAGDGKLTFETNGIGPVGHLIDAAVWEINWKVKNVKTQAHIEYGDSKNMLYVTGANVNNQFETVLHIACTGAAGKRPAEAGELEPGASAANQQVIDAVWGKFSTGEGPANTKNVQDEPLKYWGGVYDPAAGVSWTARLMKFRDARCASWSSFFVDALGIHGVVARPFEVRIIRNEEAANPGHPMREWWGDLPTPPGTELVIGVMQFGPIPAQNNEAPQSRFFNHWMVRIDSPSHCTTVAFDPSYG